MEKVLGERNPRVYGGERVVDKVYDLIEDIWRLRRISELSELSSVCIPRTLNWSQFTADALYAASIFKVSPMAFLIVQYTYMFGNNAVYPSINFRVATSCSTSASTVE